MLRGMPLKEMHLSPTSRINSATRTVGLLMPGEDAAAASEATLCNTVRDSGELSVNVAADYMRRSWLVNYYLKKTGESGHSRLLCAAKGWLIGEEAYRQCNPRLQPETAPGGVAGNGLVSIGNASRCRCGVRRRHGRVDERLEARREFRHDADTDVDTDDTDADADASDEDDEAEAGSSKDCMHPSRLVVFGGWKQPLASMTRCGCGGGRGCGCRYRHPF